MINLFKKMLAARFSKTVLEIPTETVASWAGSGAGGCDVQAWDDLDMDTGQRPNETAADYGRRLQVEEYEKRMSAPTGPVAVLTLRQTT